MYYHMPLTICCYTCIYICLTFVIYLRVDFSLLNVLSVHLYLNVSVNPYLNVSVLFVGFLGQASQQTSFLNITKRCFDDEDP